MAETRKDAETAFDFFLEAYGPKYEKATACLAKDRDALLSFYDFPAEHWKACADDEPHREHLRHGSPSHLSDQGLPVTQDGDGHGLQALPGGQQEMAEAQWIRSVRRDHSRRQIREWRTPGSSRRMTTHTQLLTIAPGWRREPILMIAQWAGPESDVPSQ